MLFRRVLLRAMWLRRGFMRSSEAAQPQDYIEKCSEKHRFSERRERKPVSIAFLFVLICFTAAFLLSCSTKPTDLRTLVPAESLIYLESNDLAATLQPLIDAEPFRESTKTRPDFSALKGVQIAVAVTGFETSEEKLTDENSLARVRPRFVAIADTHSWNYVAVSFAEQKLGGFVADIYGGEPKLAKTEKYGGKYYTWTANDDRKAFGLAIDSLIYFGNDETAIEKCLAVRRGEADSIAKAGKVPSGLADVLAVGYVSPDGIAQIASVAGMQLAAQSSDESETQSAIAGIVPQLIRGTITDASWTMKRKEKWIEDVVTFTSPPGNARVFSETITATDSDDPSIFAFIPGSAPSVTRYRLKDARLAWRSVLLAAQKQTDSISGRIIEEVARLAVEPYGIKDPELFLASIGPTLITVRTDAESDDTVLIAKVENLDNIKKSVSDEINFTRPPTALQDGELWQSDDGDIAFAREADFVIVGSAKTVRQCLEIARNPGPAASGYRERLTGAAPVSTTSHDSTTGPKLLDVIAHEIAGDVRVFQNSTTETRFTRTGIERRTTSDFGLIGSIIGFLDED